MEAATQELEQVTWELGDLIRGEDLESGEPEAAVTSLLDRADELAEAFARAHEDHVAELDGPGLVEAMEQLAEISELAGRAASYAHLRFAADTEAPANGALVQMVSERGTAIQTKLLFFELADGRTVRALHIVVKDLELRFCIDSCIVWQHPIFV